jgi:hypothetical protein
VPVFQLTAENLYSVLERYNKVPISYYGKKNYGHNQCDGMNKGVDSTHVLSSHPHMTHSESEWE